jgi:hypothetical protein
MIPRALEAATRPETQLKSEADEGMV